MKMIVETETEPEIGEEQVEQVNPNLASLSGEDMRRIDITQKRLDSKYGPIVLLDCGAQNIYGVSEWGPAKTPRGILIERASEIKSPRAERNKSRGYGIETLIQNITQLPEARKNHIAGLIDFWDLEKEEGFTFSVIDHIKGKNLRERVSEKPLNKTEIRKVFSDLLQAAKYYTSHGMFHRDFSEGNTMLSRESGLEGVLLDFGIACNQDKVEPKALPTSGYHFCMDPLLFPQFTGKQKIYGIDSEIYEIADLLYFSGTGKHIVEYDPDNRIAISLDDGDSLLNEKGEIVPEKHEKAIERALDVLPEELKRYSEIIKKGMTIDERIRYKSIDQLIEDFNLASESRLFEKIAEPGFWKTAVKRAASNWKPLTAIASAAAIALGSLTYGIWDKKENLEKTIARANEDATKITLAVDQNGKELIIDNNIVELQEPQIMVSRGKEYVSYPKKDKVIEVKQGETLDIYVPLKEKPWKSATKLWRGLCLPSFRGRAYIEGGDPIEFHSSPESFNEAYTRDMGGPMAGNPRYKIPNDLPDGVHNLIIEIDAPKITANPNVSDASKGLKVEKEDQIINRRIIPLVVGNVKDRIRLGSANIEGYTHSAMFFELGKDYDGTMPTNINYQSAILNEGYKENQSLPRHGPSNVQNINLSLPKSTNTQTTALGILARDDNGKPIYSVCVPIKSEDIMDRERNPNAEPMYWYRLGTPGTNFWKEVRAQKAALYSEKAKEAQVKR